MSIFRFRVPLKPKPLKRHRLGRRNRVYDPNVAEKEAWIRAAIQQHPQHLKPLEGPVTVHLCFNLKRPKAHFRTGRFKSELKPTAPKLPTSKYYGDIDNLAKLVLDCMNGVFLVDDEQIVALHLRRRFSDADFTDVNITPVLGDEESDEMDLCFETWCKK